VAQLFRPAATTLFRVLLVSAVAAPVLLVIFLIVLARTPLGTFQYRPLVQPVQFDHRHHAGDEAIDCRYCHSTVERSSTAGYPSTATCLNCHAQVWNRSDLLAPVRAAYFADRSIPWRRVHRLPDFVYFDHRIHVNKGIGCVTCHGRVDLMPAIEQVAPLTMGWCLGCHRDPAPHLRPLDQITSMTWEPPRGAAGAELSRRLARELDVHARTSCTTCHR
jgi:hypothetical protein